MTDETIRKKIKTGEIVALRVGHEWRITERALEDYEREIRSRCSTRPDTEAAS
jgi:excisionase family DNA binding protein